VAISAIMIIAVVAVTPVAAMHALPLVMHWLFLYPVIFFLPAVPGYGFFSSG
jgi:hypothetical protein